VVQKRKYYYVHLFFIYTKKKIDEILGNCNENEESQETEDLAPQKPKVEKKVETTKLKPLVPSVPTVLDKWINNISISSKTSRKAPQPHHWSFLRSMAMREVRLKLLLLSQRFWRRFWG
jgi:hypothetical protein